MRGRYICTSQSTSKYNPYRDKELATFRRNLVLKNLMENDFITYTDYEILTKQKINLKKKKVF